MTGVTEPLDRAPALHQVKDGTSAVTEAITAAVRDSGGKALGGRAVFIPLLERCKTETTVQVAYRYTQC